MRTGPLHMMAVGFEKGQFEDEIFRELEMLQGKGIIKLIDILFVHKTLEGTVFRMDLEEISADVKMQYGSFLGPLIGLENEEIEVADIGEEEVSLNDHTYGLSEEDLQNIIDQIPSGSSAAIVLIEHIWANKLSAAFRSEGCYMLAQGLLTPEPLIRLRGRMAEIAETRE